MQHPTSPAYNQPMSADAPPQTLASVSELDAAVGYLRNSIEALEAKLTAFTVARPEPVGSAQATAPKPAMSTVRNGIASSTMTINELTDRLNRLRSAID